MPPADILLVHEILVWGESAFLSFLEFVEIDCCFFEVLNTLQNDREKWEIGVFERKITALPGYRDNTRRALRH